MEDLCIVIPVMSRQTNGIEHVKETLAANTPILNSCNTCIYVNQKDYESLKGDLAEIFHTVIPRTEDDSALQWRSYLCMEQATHRFPKCKYFMWLEDDVFLHPNFEEVLKTCKIFEKMHLLNVIIPFVKQNYLNDTPLDYQLFTPNISSRA